MKRQKIGTKAELVFIPCVGEDVDPAFAELDDLDAWPNNLATYSLSHVIDEAKKINSTVRHPHTLELLRSSSRFMPDDCNCDVDFPSVHVDQCTC